MWEWVLCEGLLQEDGSGGWISGVEYVVEGSRVNVAEECIEERRQVELRVGWRWIRHS